MPNAIMKTTTVRVPEAVLSSLDGIAEASGRSRSWLIQDALFRYIQDEAWYVEAVKKGIADVDAGRTLSHEEMKREIRTWGFRVDD